MEFRTKSREETLQLGKKLGKCLRPGDVVLLFGELGSGKTTLTQGIAHGLEVKKDEYVRSPSFTLINQYQGKYPIYHIDLYRLETWSEIENLGLEEVFSDQGVAIVEWAEKLELGQNDEKSSGFEIGPKIEIHIGYLSDEQRSFDIQSINFKDQTHGIFSLQ